MEEDSKYNQNDSSGLEFSSNESNHTKNGGKQNLVFFSSDESLWRDNNQDSDDDNGANDVVNDENDSVLAENIMDMKWNELKRMDVN